MSDPKDARDLFDRLLPAGLLRAPDRARDIDAIFCFKITGDDGGDWTIDCTRDAPSCFPGVPIKAHCVVEMSAFHFQQMLRDPNAGMQLFFQQRLRIFGDPKYTEKIATILELAQTPAAAIAVAPSRDD